MEDIIIRIENKVDKISDKIGSIDSTLAAQHESLKDHIRRTELLEADVAPIKKHVAMVSGALKLVGLVGIIATIAEGTVEVLKYFGKI